MTTDSANGAKMETTFIITQIPGTAQYKRASWDGHQAKHEQISLDEAQEIARKDPSIAYFFRSTGFFTLEGNDNNPDRNFHPNDADFFSGDNFWLGGASGVADTYLVAEVYDTSKPATKQSLLDQLKKAILNKNYVLSSTGTQDKPLEIKVGFVFCEFQDVKGGNITSLKEKLMGPKNQTANSPYHGLSAFEEFFFRESNGRVKLVVETNFETKWTTLPKNYKQYKDNWELLAQDADEQITFPDDWKIAMFAFPDTDYGTKDNHWVGISQCQNGKSVDKGSQNINYTFLDPSDYNPSIPNSGVHFLTIHEAMHALGLVDLYYIPTYRSYGWSIMSDMRTGWHITEFEKLILGWRDIGEYIFLKRGIIPADDLMTHAKRGIIILPDKTAHRDDFYVIEAAQEIGRGEANKQAYNTKNSDDLGLLVMMARQDSNDGRISPYVCERVADLQTESDKYGGASLAPFKKANQGKFRTNGIFSHPTPNYAAADGRKITRVIGVEGSYRASNKAVMLRENERIVLADQTGSAEQADQQFQLTSIGVIGFGTLPSLLNTDGEPIANSIEALKLASTDYGYCAFVDNTGNFCLAKATDNKPAPDAILMKWGPPSGIALPNGNYFFKIEQRDAVTYVSVYETKTDGSTERKHDLFRKPEIVGGWQKTDGNYTITFQGDGNLVVRGKAGNFVAGTFNDYKLTISAITFTKTGTMTWLDSAGKTLQTVSDKAGVGPFRLAVEGQDTTKPSLVVKDSTGTILYTVLPKAVS